MNKNFKESSIPELSSKALAKLSYVIGPSNIARVVTSSIYGVSTYLASAKSLTVPKAVIFRHEDHSFLAGAKVEFIPNGDDASNGQWSYTWTFYEEDLKGADCIEAEQNSFVSTHITAAGAKLYNMKYADSNLAILMTVVIMEKIAAWLDENASETESATLTLDGCFTATAEIEDGTIVKGFVPSGEMKVLIKDDAAIQEA